MSEILFFIIFGIAVFSLLLRVFFLILFYPSKWKACDIERTLSFPPLSVIIAAKNEAKNLSQFLPLILEQDYPEFEVVVVNDCSLDETREVLYNLQEKYPNLRYTWVPENAVSQTGKKFALSIGIKAAKYEWLVFTDADCFPQDNVWLKGLASNMTDDKDFVLAYGGYKASKGLLNQLIRYDTLKIAMRYSGYPKLGKVYMGVGRNMAYRKSLWVENKGFAAFSRVASGDDDLFVNAYAKASSTAFCMDKSTKINSIPSDSFNAWIRQKSRHLSTGIYYPKWLRFSLILEPVNQLFSPLIIIPFLVLFYDVYFAWILAFFWIIIKISEALSVRKSECKIDEQGLWVRSAVFDVILPLIYIIFAVSVSKRSKSKTWK
jgi:poly-beta-1,6-N-acetyl-D-glucosamine synthase